MHSKGRTQSWMDWHDARGAVGHHTRCKQVTRMPTVLYVARTECVWHMECETWGGKAPTPLYCTRQYLTTAAGCMTGGRLIDSSRALMERECIRELFIALPSALRFVSELGLR